MKNVFFVFLFFAIGLSYSQTYTLTQGVEFDDPHRRTGLLYIEADESNFYMLRTKTDFEKDAILCAFDNISAKMVYEKPVTMSYDEDFLYAFNKNGKISIISSYADWNTMKESFLLRQFDSKTGEYKPGQVKVIDERALFKNEYRSADFTVKFSPDGQKMLTILTEENKKSNKKIVAKLYDAGSGRKIWEKEPIKVFDDKGVYTSEFLVDNTGKLVYLISFFRPGTEEDVAFAVGYSGAGSVQHTYLRIPLENKTLMNVNLNLVHNSIIFTGEYIDGLNRSKSSCTLKESGFFFINIDAEEMSIKSQSYEHLNSQILAKLDYEDKNMYSYNMGIDYKNKVFRHFKTLYLGGAFYLVKYHGYSFTINENYGPVEHDIGKEIIIYKYNAAGRVEWMKIIPRAVRGKSDGTNLNRLNYCGKNKLHLLYYEHVENLKAFPDVNNYKQEDYKDLKNTGATDRVTVCVTVEPNGDLKREAIEGANINLSRDEDKVFIRQGNKIIVDPTLDKRKRARFDLVSLPD